MRKASKILITMSAAIIFILGHTIVGQTVPAKPERNPKRSEKRTEKSESFEDFRFIDNGDGTVTDRKTNLMWAKADSMVTGGGMNWIQSREYVSNLLLGGYSDWRMPTIRELKSLFDFKFSLRSHAVNVPIHIRPIFDEGGATWLWSCETGSCRRACIISFNVGKVFEYAQGGNASACGVRAVRGRRR